ncbi:MAG: uracil phosphoribosyltransferase [Phycisphaerales bacterium]|nr:uracil phosphoribosyltransferase [Phycisphaerales bacterium]
MPHVPPHFPNLTILDHPVIQDRLTRIRDESTPPQRFRRLLDEIAGLMTFRVCHDLPTREVSVTTPLETAEGTSLQLPITLVPILRAGIGMTDGILSMLPEARVGHLGVYRDEETSQPVPYYQKMPPDIARGPVLVVDPMLATGGSAAFALDRMKELGCSNIRMICLVVAPEGVTHLLEAHPDVPVYTAALDRCLDENNYIRPGLGDAGDRIFGTQ